jgi:hypothetical protein
MVETRDAFERPGRRVGGQLLPRRLRGELAHFSEDSLHVARQLGRRAVEVAFECREPRLRAIETVLRGVRGRDADFGKARRLLHEPPHRLFMDVAQRAPFLLNDPLEILEPLIGVLLQAIASVAKLAKMRFELADRLGVSIGGGGPLLQDRRAVIRKRREPLLDWARVAGSRVTHRVDLRLQIREALLKSDVVRLCANHARMIHKTLRHPNSRSRPVMRRNSSCYFFVTVTVADDRGDVLPAASAHVT